MTSVYTFHRNNTNTASIPGLQQNNLPILTNSNSVEIPKLDFNEINFPKLGVAKSSPQDNSNKVEPEPCPLAQVSCWSNKTTMEIIKIPFPVQPIASRNMIPPLFNKARKNKKQTYEEETESDDDYEYANYEEYQEEEVSDSDNDF